MNQYNINHYQPTYIPFQFYFIKTSQPSKPTHIQQTSIFRAALYKTSNLHLTTPPTFSGILYKWINLRPTTPSHCHPTYTATPRTFSGFLCKNLPTYIPNQHTATPPTFSISVSLDPVCYFFHFIFSKRWYTFNQSSRIIVGRKKG